ncbi:MAG: hypothetical protein HXX08_18025 [Chloroflexi bacterium]|uniref:Tetratricopeptide repeat protein n=1 Tax=Candidatus Chlorohelix allophototropha TaxID=3003348 RepID=A0A8T7M6L8_9CHLR|nr:hypothetical protein [Chloroflexota bacterium]WJW69660.1 hypothetical protein OZ401_003288 [Chloroflexota bacterium L227-S17]
MAQSDMKETAYVALNQLHMKYPADTHLMLWIAFTSPDILASKSFIRRAERLNPDNPDLPAARQWLQAEEAKRVLATPSAQNNTSPQPVGESGASFSPPKAALKKKPPINPLIITLISVVILILFILVVALLVKF